MALIYEKKGRIAYITLNRPEAQNAFDPETVVDIIAAWKDYPDDDNLRCAIITGSGHQVFSYGADLKKLIPLSTGVLQPKKKPYKIIQRYPNLAQKAFLRTRKIDNPIIAAINGLAIAGVMEMPPARFYLVNVLSAIFWAPVVLLPVVVLGASLTVASQASTRLVIVLILLAAMAWLLYLFFKGLINRLSAYGRLTRLQISSLLIAVFIMIAGVSVFNIYKTLNTAEQLVLSQSTKAGDWWADDWTMLPAYRSGALNYASSPMSIQWAGKLDRIEDLLIRQGWARPEPLTYTSMMLWLTPDTN